MKQKIEAAGYSTIGKVRKNNEDNFYFSGKIMEEKNFGTENVLEMSFAKDEGKVFAIFDGMGGEAKGERASFLAAQELQKMVEKEEVIDWAEYAEVANERIVKEMKEGKRMGSTVAAIQFLEDYISISNLGDSRIYAIIGGECKQLSKDHTEQMLLEELNIKPKHKPRLTEHLGIRKDEIIIHPFQKIVFYEDLEKVMICSDGITDMVDDMEIERVLKTTQSSKKCCEQLVKEAMEKGGIDNTTIMVFTINA